MKTTVRYYKSYTSHSLLNHRPCDVTYYYLSSDVTGSGYYGSFTMAISRKYGSQSSSLDCLTRSHQTWRSIRDFRKYHHAKPCSAEEYKKNFYKLKRKLIAKAKKIKA